MANITEDDVKLIVERNIRDAGLQGQFEQGWKRTVQTSTGPVQQQFNLQDLRDIIAKSVVDALQNNITAGTISENNTQGVPIVINQNSDVVVSSDPENTGDNVLINPSQSYIFLPNPLTEPPKAARQGDHTAMNVLTDPIFVTIYNAMIAALYTLDLTNTFKNLIDNVYGGLPSPADIQISGVITEGSDSVRIGENNGYIEL